MNTMITLDHPVDVNGITIRYVPIRPATASDRTAAKRAGSCKWGRADREMLAVIAATMEDDDPAKEQKLAQGFVSCALVRTITGLPFSAIAQLGAADQSKIAAFLDAGKA